jgi:hypothetical protein
MVIHMSTLILTDEARGFKRRNGFFRSVAEFFAGIRLARAMAHRYDVLSNLSDAQLDARGIKREDIPSIVVNGKYEF